MKPQIYLCRNKNTNIRLKSSSGGVFYELAAWAISQKGVVFGAAFNKDWGVDIIKIEKINDIEKLMGSKYTLANINNAYQEAKKELEKNRIVLYSGTPCQIAGLRQYLKKDYDKLFCLEVCCHGVVPQHIWHDYLKTLKRDGAHIIKISFRDKTYGWRKFSFRVDYDDSTTFIETHPKNSYMQLFLKNHYLLPSCYNCRFKDKNTQADMAVGDFWGRHGIRYKKFNDNLGTSIVSINNEKGITLLDSICGKIEQKKVSKHRVLRYNGAWNSKIKAKRENYDSNLFKSKIKDIIIITLPLRSNMGGILQAYALQSFLKQEGYKVTFAQSKYSDTLQFVHNNINIKWMKHRFNRFRDIKKDEFDAIVVGSDQVWRRYYIYGNISGYFLNFAKKWNVRKIAYSASFGKETWDYIKPRTLFIKKRLSKFDRVSVREESAVELCKKYLGASATVTVDPTLLFDDKFYINKCKSVPHKDGFFAYILDSSKEISSTLKAVSEKTNTPIYPHDKNSVEDWLACFRDAKFVVTDSYHGCIFSIIFNKPFVCIANTKRGNARFNHLIKTYGIQNRVFDNFNSINYSMLKIKPNLLSKVEALKKESVIYLKESLATPLVVRTKELLK